MGSCLSSDCSWRSSTPLLPASGAKKKRKEAKKGQRKKAASPDSREEGLHRIPGRMFLNGASSIASLFTQQGKKGTNQDAMIVWENFCSRRDTVFCGVFDGHGPFGHMVARRVRDSLPLKLSSHWQVNSGGDHNRENSISTVGSMNSEDSSSVQLEEESRVSIDFEEKEKLPEIFTTLKQSFLKACKIMDKELRLHPNIDCFCSGSTAVTVVKQGQDLVIGNIGDSRAVLGTRDEDDCLTAVQLTVDLKPSLPREAERIRRCKGRVFALRDEPEVARVWLPDNDSPGLAMARAFGDFCLKDFGLISVPEISYRRITDRDEFIILATDGVWDVLSNKEVVDIVASAPTRSYAARALVESAVRSWRIKYPTSKVDDCAVVCLFLNSEEAPNSSSSSSNPNSSSSSSKNIEVGDAPVDSIEADSYGREEPSLPTSLDRSGTVRSGPQVIQEQLLQPAGGSVMEVEGVSRVDTMLTLPRFVADDKIKKSA